MIQVVHVSFLRYTICKMLLLYMHTDTKCDAENCPFEGITKLKCHYSERNYDLRHCCISLKYEGEEIGCMGALPVLSLCLSGDLSSVFASFAVHSGIVTPNRVSKSQRWMDY